MLTSKQQKHLRSLAHHLNPIFQIGKGGVNDNLIKHIEQAIEVRELIKLTVLKNCLEDKQEVAIEIAERSKAELVQVIGKIIVLYKESKEHKTIELP